MCVWQTEEKIRNKKTNKKQKKTKPRCVSGPLPPPLYVPLHHWPEGRREREGGLCLVHTLQYLGALLQYLGQYPFATTHNILLLMFAHFCIFICLNWCKVPWYARKVKVKLCKTGWGMRILGSVGLLGLLLQLQYRISKSITGLHFNLHKCNYAAQPIQSVACVVKKLWMGMSILCLHLCVFGETR